MESNIIDLLFTLQDNQINQNQIIDYIHESKIKNDFFKNIFLNKLIANIISFKIGNTIFTLSKDFLFNKLNLEFHFINNYECDNFIFG